MYVQSDSFFQYGILVRLSVNPMCRTVCTSSGKEIIDDNLGYILLILHQSISCGYSLELPRRGNSNEYPQDMFWCKINKILSSEYWFYLGKCKYIGRREFFLKLDQVVNLSGNILCYLGIHYLISLWHAVGKTIISKWKMYFILSPWRRHFMSISHPIFCFLQGKNTIQTQNTWTPNSLPYLT